MEPDIFLSLVDIRVIIPLVILISWRIVKKTFHGLDMETIKTILPEIEIIAPNDTKYTEDPMVKDVQVRELTKDDFHTSD